MKNKGFTLTEIMIVIAIIVILAAVLVPNLSGARISAYNSAARSCASQISLAEDIYKLDNGAYTDDLSNLDPSVVEPCVNNLIDVTFTSATATSFSADVKHERGTETYSVTESGIN